MRCDTRREEFVGNGVTAHKEEAPTSLWLEPHWCTPLGGIMML